MNFDFILRIPDLWGDNEFKKTEWNTLNYLIGPNGTGKTRFLEKLHESCTQLGLKVRYLSSERLSGFEKKTYNLFSNSEFRKGINIGNFSDLKIIGEQNGLSSVAFIILKEKIDIRIKIEAFLSTFFDRKIELFETGGYLNPKIQKNADSEAFFLREGECHGLKELITLLTLIYDDEKNCIIIDEPELHLHPQFQSFFLNEMRKISGNPLEEEGKKCFFIATHSPYFIDIRSLQELENCIFFQPGKIPQYIDQWDNSDDIIRIKRLLPRMNTHHKQFFFASRPVFVEGYFDQQIFSLIQERRDKLVASSGSCFIDVGGKDELDLFYRLSIKFNIDSQFIADLDALFKGKLRQTILNEQRCQDFFQSHGVNPSNAIGELETKLGICIEKINQISSDIDIIDDDDIRIIKIIENCEIEMYIKRYSLLLMIINNREFFSKIIPNQNGTISFILGRLDIIREAFKKCGVYILPNGPLEAHIPDFFGSILNINDDIKRETFEKSKEFLLNNENSADIITNRYQILSDLLDQVTGAKDVNMDLFINNAICDWIYKMQSAYKLFKFTDIDSVKKISKIEWNNYSRILEFVRLDVNDDGFSCTMKLAPIIDPNEKSFFFDDKISASQFSLNH